MVGVLVKSVSYVEESPTILATIVCGIGKLEQIIPNKFCVVCNLFSQANHWSEITKN